MKALKTDVKKQKDEAKSKAVGAKRPQSETWAWLLLGGVVLFVVFVRMLHLHLAIERDEGEYGYAGQLLLQGIPPYKMAYNMKLPGTYAAYALIMAVFGQTGAGIRLGLLVVNIGCIVLVFMLGKRIFNAAAGLAMAATYAMMSQGLGILGWSAHATHFVMLSALIGLLVMLRALESGRVWLVFLSGLMFGLSFLFKQPGILFGVFAGLMIIGKEFLAKPVNWSLLVRKAAVFCLGMALPFGLTCLALWWAGVFERFWFWTAVYPSAYAQSADFGWSALSRYFGFFARSERVFWTLAGLGLFALSIMKISRGLKLSLYGFVLVSAVAVSIGFHYRAHYFVMSIPAVALLVAVFLISCWQFLMNAKISGAVLVPVILFGCVCCYVASAEKDYLFPKKSIVKDGLFYGGNACAEAVEVAEYIKKNSEPNDRIAVLGSEPAIYFYSQRRSATGYIYTYALMEQHQYALKMQKEMIQEIETAQPEYLVYCNTSQSWLRTKNSDSTILLWFDRYVRTNYTLVGLVKATEYGPVAYWDKEARPPGKEDQSFLLVLRRDKPAMN